VAALGVIAAAVELIEFVGDLGAGLYGGGFAASVASNPDISRVECTHIQGIRAADVVVYLNALITQKMGALGSPEGREKRAGNRE